MFSSGLEESQGGKVFVHGVRPEAFQVVLNYLYTGIVRLPAGAGTELLVDAFSIAHEYMLEGLARACSRRV